MSTTAGRLDPIAEGAITPYTIDIAPETLDDLHRRLAATRFAVSFDPTGWADGTSANHLHELVEYWRDGYDWNAQQRRLNELPQFTSEFDGELVHFVWLRADGSSPARPPVVLTHGWPGSFVEFLGIAPELARYGHDVVIPTIPGFGFPGPPWSRPATVLGVASAWAALMKRLGYDSYYAHGGDIGAVISRVLGMVDPEHLAGLHMNSGVGGVPEISAIGPDGPHTRAEQGLVRYATDLAAYAHLHATRPLSIGHALADSPAGLLAWIAERFHDWTEAATTGHDTVSRDELLTNTMVYWLNNAAASAATFYKTNGFFGATGEIPVSTTPTAVSIFANDILISDRALSERFNNIVQWREHTRGGHFPALEVPHLLAADIMCAFAADGPMATS